MILTRTLKGLAFALAAACAAAALAQSRPTAVEDKLRTVATRSGMIHLLPATLATTQWGWFDNAQPPVMTIASGDTVMMETLMHSQDRIVPGTTIEQIKKLRTDNPGRGPHSLTGPIYIEGAEPGDVLKVKLNKIVPRSYAVNFNVPGMFGEFPKEFPEGQARYVYLDLEHNTAEFMPGVTIPVRPFPGTIGVARAEPGQYSSVPPGRYGGNLDIRELTAGTTLYLPVFVKGALLWSGDSHAAQGNGEINLTALETAFRDFTISVEVIKGQRLQWPRIETPTHWLTVGYDADLNKALDILKAETIAFQVESHHLPPADGEAAMIRQWDCRVAEVVNVVKGAYCFNPKDAKAALPPPLPDEETPRNYVTVGRNADLNRAMDTAAMAMIELLVKERQVSRLDAYGIASVAMDCRIAAPSGRSKAVHCLLPKSIFTG